MPTRRWYPWRTLLLQSASVFYWINGYSRLRCNETASQSLLSFSALFSRRQLKVQWGESSVTYMEGSIRLDVNCGCIRSTTTMGGAGWGEPAGHLGCSQAGLWAWDVGERCWVVGKISTYILKSRNLNTIWTLGRFSTYVWGKVATDTKIA